MARQAICDICKRPTNKLVVKLLYVPIRGDNGKRGGRHSDYTHRADVGECCSERLFEFFNFHKRQTFAEYQAGR